MADAIVGYIETIRGGYKILGSWSSIQYGEGPEEGRQGFGVYCSKRQKPKEWSWQLFRLLYHLV